ncbi:alpha/beta-hydrolase [Punctularia strigosozonata HHB-11173 SS5]|uniref:Alpha/beta-hydrolase n=1 Tax=Punctularia strigosozonata (strain HHB-11173) TaxID=741275 RepID=R7S542_PUNST|nr:alpha/beta-hydrolase [Punctularia strigosozonata HHB-11173 SS5]EIN04436.1 alpha/beta-hydrolase [Punctularia strigosozonata HHB-11173 SS5]
MDAIRSQTQEQCESISDVLPITIQALLPSVLAAKGTITSVERKTFKYGSTDRHQLDVYYPPSGSAEPSPVLFWAYGGGFVHGDRILEPSQGLVYATVGSFFARKGLVVVIPDYRLAPEAKFPAQSEDIRDAILWVIKNAASLNTGNVTLDVDRIVASGHSAGAINVATLYLHPELLAGTDILARTKALVLEAGTYAFEIPGLRSALPTDIMEQYYGTADTYETHVPLGLLKALPADKVKALPPVLIVDAEKEPTFVVKSEDLFKQELERIDSGRKVDRIVAKGHNHISVNWVLGTGDGEEWAEEVIQWLRKVFA